VESEWRRNVAECGFGGRNCPTGMSHYGSLDLLGRLRRPILMFGQQYFWSGLFLRYDGQRFACFATDYGDGWFSLVQDVNQPVPCPTFPFYSMLGPTPH